MRSSVERPPVWEDKRARSDGSIDSEGGLLPPDTDPAPKAALSVRQITYAVLPSTDGNECKRSLLCPSPCGESFLALSLSRPCWLDACSWSRSSR